MKKITIFISLSLLFYSSILPESIQTIYILNSAINFRFLSSVIVLVINTFLVIIWLFINKGFKYSKVSKSVIIFIIYLLISILFQNNLPTGAGLWGIITFLTPIIYLFLFAQVIKNFEDIRFILIIIVFIAFMHASQAIISSMINSSIFRLTTRIGGTGPLANLLMIISSLALYLFIDTKAFFKKYIFLIQYIVIMIGLLLTFSRLPILIGGILNFLLLVQFLYKTNKSKRYRLKFDNFIVTYFLVGLSICIFSYLIISLSFDLNYLFRFNDSGDVQRQAFLNSSIDLFTTNIFLGNGWGFYAFRGFRDSINILYPQDPHSSFLVILVEVGILGFIFFINMYYAILKQINLNIRLSILKYALDLSIIAFLIHSVFSSELFYSINVVSFFWIIVALLEKNKYMEVN